MSPYSKIIAIFSDFCYFEIKSEMRDVLAKMRDISQKAGFPARLRDGLFQFDNTKSGRNSSKYFLCCLFRYLLEKFCVTTFMTVYTCKNDVPYI